MVRLRLEQKLIFLIPVLLGVIAGITSLYLLAALAVLSLFVILSLMSSIKGYRFVYQFFFSFLICLPINIRVSCDVFNYLNDGDIGIAMVIGLAFIFSFILISVELIFLGIISYFIWGEQDDALIVEKEKNAEKELERKYRSKREEEILSLLWKRSEESIRTDDMD